MVGGPEAYDDGNRDGGDGCNRRCRIETCGDGAAQSDMGEVCDGEDLAGASCESLGFSGGALACAEHCGGFDTDECEIAPCGDGFEDCEAGEQCDDGNDVDGDGCSSECIREDAMTFMWIGTQNELFSDCANWDPAGRSGELDMVIVLAEVVNNLLLPASVRIGSLDIQAGFTGEVRLEGIDPDNEAWSVSGGTFDAQTARLSVGALLLSNDAFFRAPDAQLTIRGSLSVHDATTFESETGVVVMEGNPTVIDADEVTLYELETSSAGGSYRFMTGTTVRVTGTWTAIGEAGALVTLGIEGATASDEQWRIDSQGDRVIDFIEVSNSFNSNIRRIEPANWTDGGNNVGWEPDPCASLLDYASCVVNELCFWTPDEACVAHQQIDCSSLDPETVCNRYWPICYGAPSIGCVRYDEIVCSALDAPKCRSQAPA